jgi:Lrp/AsnC family leucine-responsive transcriptional regulator
MNRSRYVTRPLDNTDRAIIAALSENGRMTVRELAALIGLSSPSVTERIHKLEDTGAIRGYTVLVDPTVFGLGIAAHVRMRAMPGEVKRVAKMLIDTPEVVEADRVTGEDCFLAKVLAIASSLMRRRTRLSFYLQRSFAAFPNCNAAKASAT